MEQAILRRSKLNNKVLFIGNDINNLTNKESWENLVAALRQKVGKKDDAEDLRKQFPMVFENLLSYGILNHKISHEIELKNIVAERITQIEPNEIHQRIIDINPKHTITANYDFVLEKGYDATNQSRIIEKRYSVFRRYKDNNSGRNFWHVHGDYLNPATINLGFEHYCGQLQDLRNYVVSGTNYKTKNYHNGPLTKRLANLTDEPESWVDLFFTKEIHIIGLCLDFIEIDLWWLLTWRAKLIGRNRMHITNKIFYYIPEKYCGSAKGKIELLGNMAVEVIIINKDGKDFYNSVFDLIKPKTKSIKEVLGL